MSILSQLACTPVYEGEPPVTDEEIAQLHPLVLAWKIVDDGGIRKLRHTFPFDGEATADVFVRNLENMIRNAKSRAEIERRENQVQVSWWTEALRDLHPNDFILASRTEGAYSQAIVGAPGDMFTEETLPRLADLPRFRQSQARRKLAREAFIKQRVAS